MNAILLVRGEVVKKCTSSTRGHLLQVFLVGIRQSPVAWGRFSGVISQFLDGNNTRALVPFVRLLELYSCVLQLLDEDKAESLYV